MADTLSLSDVPKEIIPVTLQFGDEQKHIEMAALSVYEWTEIATLIPDARKRQKVVDGVKVDNLEDEEYIRETIQAGQRRQALLLYRALAKCGNFTELDHKTPEQQADAILKLFSTTVFSDLYDLLLRRIERHTARLEERARGFRREAASDRSTASPIPDHADPMAANGR